MRAFPVSLWLIGFFILYELYRFTHTRSAILLAVIGMDIVIFWFIKNEYARLKERGGVALEATVPTRI